MSCPPDSAGTTSVSLVVGLDVVPEFIDMPYDVPKGWFCFQKVSVRMVSTVAGEL